MKNKIVGSVVVLIVLAVGIFLLVRHNKDTVSISQNQNNTNTTPNIVDGIVQLKEGRQCYTYSHDATAAEPYSTSEFIDITISGNVVTGTKTGTQKGPDMDNGYSGTITGTLGNNSISDIFAYTIEGSQNKEKEVYRAGKVGIDKLRYPLIEQNGILVPDTNKDYTVLTYARVECTGSN